MLNKFSLKTLLIILAVLIGAYFSTKVFNKRGSSSSLRSVLVEIDTSNVSKILVSSNEESFSLEKDSGSWSVKGKQGNFIAEEVKVMNMLVNLLSIKPSRLVSKSESKWNDLQVDDSTGTRVEVYEGTSKSLDIVIGKFDVQGQRSYFSHVRLYEDKETYASDNFMSISFPKELNAFRQTRVLSLFKNDIEKIDVSLSDGLFSIEKDSASSVWSIGGLATDSTQTASLLNALSGLVMNSFADDVDKNSIEKLGTATVYGKAKEVELFMYKTSDDKTVIGSSESPNLYLDEGDKASIIFRPAISYSPQNQ